MAHSKKTLGTTPEEIREHARQRLLKYKERLEFELLRVNPA
jgi:hypothetical protein